MLIPAYEARCRASFDKQQFMGVLGARLIEVRSGEVTIELPFRGDLTQQHGFLHAGAIASIADSACGYAALTRMPEAAAVLSVEFKINLMKPAAGRLFRATGRVVKSGKTLTICSGLVQANGDGKWSDIALMQATMIAVADRNALRD